MAENGSCLLSETSGNEANWERGDFPDVKPRDAALGYGYLVPWLDYQTQDKKLQLGSLLKPTSRFNLFPLSFWEVPY